VAVHPVLLSPADTWDRQAIRSKAYGNKAERSLTKGKPQRRGGLCDITKARLIAENEEVSQPDS
jgi:hypothetical protein